MTLTRDRLYNLLPAIYRIRDGAEGEPLRALLAVVEQELEVLEGNISDLYDAWFIETCAEWVVPYIGDLLDVRELYADRPLTYDSQEPRYGQQERRAYIANTLAYRRRKGTAPILEQLTRDVTGWRSRVVEFAQLVSTTQHLDHVRPNSTTANLRADNRLRQLGSPFETQAAYSVEIRPIRQGGRYNTPNIGLYVWRLQSYPLERSTARPIAVAPPPECGPFEPRYFTFSALGRDQPLFNQPQTETNIVTLAEEINLPVLLRNASLASELEERRVGRSQGKLPSGLGYFDSDPVLQLFINRQPHPVPPEEILIRSLDPWPALEELQQATTDDVLPRTVAVDPEQGRIAFLGAPPNHVEVSYFYGFSDDLGGGSYGRLGVPERQPQRTDLDQTQIQIPPLSWSIEQGLTADPNPLATAIQTWNQTVTAWDGFERQTHIALARITIPAVQVAQVERETIRQRFIPGILGDGLAVMPGVCPREILITAGVAVDAQGQRLQLLQFQTLNLRSIDISALPKGTGILTLSYDPLAPHRPRLQLLSEVTLEGYPENSRIPLARLVLDGDSRQLQGTPDLSLRPVFQPGILQGLEVQIKPGTLETCITAGTGVDAQGRVFVLSQNCPVDLRPHQGQTRSLVIGLPRRFGASWQLDLLPPEALETLDYPVIHLANLEIPTVAIQEVNLAVRELQSFNFKGLELTTQRSQLTLAPGTITPATATSPTVRLEQQQRLDLSLHAGRTLRLFLAIAPTSGLPFDFVTPPQGRGWRHLGLVPELPTYPMDGQIVVSDNQTYSGDWTVALPARQRLSIVAANGYWPHIQGSMTVQGTAIAMESDRRQGELRLEGLRLEGNLRVAAGNLGRLTLHHCTLVPQSGSLWVEPATSPTDSCLPLEPDLTLGAFLLYSLSLIWLLIQQELGIRRSDPPLTMGEVMQRIVERITVLLAELLQMLQHCWSWVGPGCNGEDSPNPNEAQDNTRLEISLYRTITGAIHLADTVPYLRLEDCILDKGLVVDGEATDTSAMAIAAPGTAVEIRTSTVIGRTHVRQLEASNSLFTEKVTVQRHQDGCLRFSYVPDGSETPRRYQCQPDRAFQDALDQIPKAVSALHLSPSQSAQLPPLLLLGTAGEGIFRYGVLEQRATEREGDGMGWVDVTVDLSNGHVTSLLAYSRPNSSAASSIPNTLLVGTLAGQIFQAVPIQKPTPVDSPFPLDWQVPDWSTLPFPVTNAAITALLAIDLPGSGQVTVEGNILRGTATRFSQEIQVDDLIRMGEQVRRVIRLGDGEPWAIASQTRQVTGPSELRNRVQPGTTLTAQGQTRTVVAIPSEPGALVTRLQIDRPFEPDLPDGTAAVLNIDTVLTLEQAFEAPPGQPFSLPSLWAATAGGGVWRSSSEGRNWRAVSIGLPNLNVSTLLWDEAQLWAATWGNGVFSLQRSGAEGDRWVAQGEGLGDRPITSLLNTSQGLLAATLDRGVFVRSDRGWATLNDGLTSLEITALSAFQTQGMVSSEAKRVTGKYSYFIQRGLKQGDTLTIGNQSRTIDEVLSETELTTTEAFEPPLSSGALGTDAVVIAGSADGKLFRSLNGNPWQPLGLDLKSTAITALQAEAFGNTAVIVFAGTATGEVLQSDDGGQHWVSMLAGRPALAQKLQILNRVQPSFTSTQYGDPAYAQLRKTSAPEIYTGAEDGAEMGVFNSLKQPQREENLRTSLDEYLRFGLSADLFFVT